MLDCDKMLVSAAAHLLEAAVLEDSLLATGVAHAQFHQRPDSRRCACADWAPIQQPHQGLHAAIPDDGFLRSQHFILGLVQCHIASRYRPLQGHFDKPGLSDRACPTASI